MPEISAEQYCIRKPDCDWRDLPPETKARLPACRQCEAIYRARNQPIPPEQPTPRDSPPPIHTS